MGNFERCELLQNMGFMDRVVLSGIFGPLKGLDYEKKITFFFGRERKGGGGVGGRFFQIDLNPNGDDYKAGFLMTYCLGHYTDSGIFF